MVNIGDRVKSLNCGWMEAVSEVRDSGRGGKLSVRFIDTNKVRDNVFVKAFLSGNVSDNIPMIGGETLASTSDGFFKILKITNIKNVDIQFINTGNILRGKQKDALVCGYIKDSKLHNSILREKQQALNKVKEDRRATLEDSRKLARLKLQEAARKKQLIKDKWDVIQRDKEIANTLRMSNIEKLKTNAILAISSIDVTNSGKHNNNDINIDFKDRDGNWVLRFKRDNRAVQTRLGRLHNNMTQRANCKGKYQQISPSYAGVSVSNTFKDPQKFCDWAVAQIGWGEGFELEKDILVKGNKIYSENTCVFVPKVINSAIIPYSFDSCIIKARGKFCVKVKANNFEIFIGEYDDHDSAVSAYLEYRTTYVRNLAEIFKNKISEDAYKALIVWKAA